KTWRKTLYVNDTTGASDLAIDPTNPRIFYAALWQHGRRPWTMESGGESSGLWKSTDGGETWKQLAGGLPEGVVGKIGVSVSAARPQRVFALVEAEKGGLFRSDDGGQKWTRVSEDRNLIQRAWYYTHVFAHPKNPDEVFVLNVQAWRSSDGGRTFQRLRIRHGDHHDLWIDPDDPSRMIEGDDGGATITFNAGRSWSTEDNQPTAQIYRLATDDRTPYWIYGAQQDNTDIAIPSAVAGRRIDQGDWHEAGGGESGWAQPDPRDPEITWGGSYGGEITRHDRRTRQSRVVTAWPQPIDGNATRDLKYRFNWNAPILASKQEPGVVYHAAQKLLRTADEGTTWTEASPDLTRNDLSKQGYAGGPITREITGVETHPTIFSIAESPREKGVLWAGTDDGLVWITRDNTKTWQNVTPKGLPETAQVNAIDVSAHADGVAYVAVTGYRQGDDRPMAWRTADHGKTWTTIAAGLPANEFVRVVREDPGRRGLLFAGTERGLWTSLDDGASWQRFQQNLPAVPVADLQVKNGDLVLATQGRGFWILDDITPLRTWAPATATAAAHVFTPRTTPRLRTWPDWGGGGPSLLAGESGPGGVVVWYWLKDYPEASAKDKPAVALEFRQGDKLLRRFVTAKPEVDGEAKADDEGDKPLEPKAGLNRFVWDMRLLDPEISSSKETFGDFPPEGPKVIPGTYTVRLVTAAGTPQEKAHEQSFAVTADPRATASATDLQEQYELLLALRGDIERAHDLLRRIRETREQAKAMTAKAGRLGQTALAEPEKALSAKLTLLEEKIINPKIKANQDTLNFTPKLDFQFSGLAAYVGSADAKPPVASYARRKELLAQLDAVQKDFDALVAADLAAFNKVIADAAIPPVAILPKKEKKD
ncbi:MAG: glycosyl hydrolase, partial [Vicinamibacteria bacterium]|nr:glycosyl hydrolase [Vicinamibacteria bacterium]